MKFLLFLFLFIPAICYAQYTETVTITPDLHKTEVQRYQINTGTPAYPVFEDRYSTETPDATGNAYVGKQDDEPDYQNTFRMIYGFDLSGIPARSEIVSVKLIVTTTFTSEMASPSYEFDVFSYPQDPGSIASAENVWPASAVPQSYSI